jgi:transglutaminase-like putative cysteine protease
VDPYVQPCERQEALDRYAWEAIDGPGVAAIAARAAWRAARALRPGASHAELELALASAALAEVQETIRYVPDPPGVEVFQPVEVTIAKGAGDCDKLAAVLAAVDRRLGLVAWPQWVDQRGRTQNHVTTFVVAAGAPRWQDGSVRGARLDEDPWSAAARRGLAGLVGLAPAA